MNKFEYLKNQLELYLVDDEYKRLNPSYSFIENYASRLLALITRVQEDNPIQDLELYSIWKRSDIFKADLIGELYGDYRKQNKRYRDNWINQKRIIDRITADFLILAKNKYGASEASVNEFQN